MKRSDSKMHGNARASTPAAQKKAVVPAVSNHAVARPHASCDMAPYSVSSKDFLLFQAMIYRDSGIWLSEAKAALLTGRLSKRLRALGLRNFAEYYQRVDTDDEERRTMLDAITTNEEPYSLAMLLLKHFPVDRWDLEVLATDISTRVLEKAREAVYPIEKMKDIPQEYLRGYMLRGRGEDKAFMKVSPEVHRVVRFARVNLHGDSYPLQGFFDLIFCRNVLIYFDQKSKEKVIHGIGRHLSPSGLLFVGHSENLGGISSTLRTVAPTVYALMPSAANFPRKIVR